MAQVQNETTIERLVDGLLIDLSAHSLSLMFENTYRYAMRPECASVHSAYIIPA